MEKQTLNGKSAKLPDGQRVVIEDIKNGLAAVRRGEGERKGKLAICSVSNLKIELTDSEA